MAPLRLPRSGRPARGTGPRAGFTLVETLVAFAVTAAGLGALLAGTAEALRADARAAATREALRAAEALVAETGVARPIADARGETADGLAWEIAVWPVGPPGAARIAPPVPGPGAPAAARGSLAWISVAVHGPGGVDVTLGALKRATGAEPRS